MLDLSKIAGMDLAKLPGVEQSGERCIRNIQEWLLHEVSSEETAILPEDKLQHIMVGVCIFISFLFKCELEFVSFYSSISYKLGFIFLGMQPARNSYLHRRAFYTNATRCPSNSQS